MKFSLISATLLGEDGKPHTFYGVKGGNVSVPDVTENRARMCAEIERYNRIGLEEQHLLDVLQDFVSDGW